MELRPAPWEHTAGWQAGEAYWMTTVHIVQAKRGRKGHFVPRGRQHKVTEVRMSGGSLGEPVVQCSCSFQVAVFGDGSCGKRSYRS